MFILAEAGNSDFLTNMLEKGGLPALALGIIFIIFFFWVRSQAKQNKEDKEATSAAFVALQKERLTARKREAEQYNDLMQAYEDIVDKFIDQSAESTKAITRLSERVGQCPLRGTALVVGKPEGSDGD